MCGQTEPILTKGQSITQKEFDRLYAQLMTRDWVVDGKTYNLNALGWTWGYHNKKRAFGSCRFTRSKGRGRVMMSSMYVPINLNGHADVLEDTIRHEIAHAIDYIRRDDSGHDVVWKRIAVAVGAKPQSCTSEGVSPKAKWIGECPNGHKHTRHRLSKSTRGSACGKCCNLYNNGEYTNAYLIRWKENK